MVAPTIHNPACREQLVAAARQVSAAVERLVEASAGVKDDGNNVAALMAAAQRLAEELERLLAHADPGEILVDELAFCRILSES